MTTVLGREATQDTAESCRAGTAIAPPPPLRQPGPGAAVVSWEVISDPARVADLTEEWALLAAGRDASFFVTPEWIDTWRATIAPEVRPRLVVGRDDDAKLVALWPLGLSSTPGAHASVLEPMGGAVASGERLDPLTTLPGLEPQLIDQGRRIAAESADLIRWSELGRPGPTLDALRTESPSCKPQQERERRLLPLADLPATYEEYVRTLSKKLRGHLRRQEDVATRQHGMTWRLNEEGGSLALAVDAFIDLHGRCWRHRGQSGNFLASRFVAFIRDFTALSHRRGWLRLHRLCDGQRTVAALLAFHHGQRAYYYQGGWDPAIAELSPGSLCIAQAIRSAIDEGLEVFDFLRGDEPYKRRWSNRHEETATIVEAVTLKGRTILACNAGKERFKRGLTHIAGPQAWETLKSCLVRGRTGGLASEDVLWHRRLACVPTGSMSVPQVPTAGTAVPQESVAQASRLCFHRRDAGATRELGRTPGRPLRVCHVLYRWSRCGMELQLAAGLRCLDTKRVKAWIASSMPPETREPQLPAGVQVRAFAQGRVGPAFHTWLADQLEETSTEVVHARGLWMLPAALRAATAAGGLPVVFSFHGLDDANRDVSWWRRRQWSKALRQCAAVVTVSKPTRDDLCAALDISPDRVEVIQNGVDVAWFGPSDDRRGARRTLGLSRTRPVLLCVGSLMPVKGHDVFIEALRETGLPHDAVQVIMVGTDHLQGALQRQAAMMLPGWDIRFVGNVDDVRPYYAAADALISPSRSEGLSNTILEAMASGLPVVATAVGGTRELVVSGETGWLVPPGDPRSLADAISELLDDAAEGRRWGLAGRQSVERDYPLARAVGRYQDLYERVHQQHG